MSKKIVYIVIGDDRLNAGDGAFLKHLPDLKKHLMKHQIPGDWILVLGIHGSEEIIAERVSVLSGGHGAYNAAEIEKIFLKDPDFAKWRHKWGPKRLVLNSCAVSKRLESAMMKALMKPGSQQSSHGLGHGCQPKTTVMTLASSANKDLLQRSDYNKLTKAEQREQLGQLRDLNRKWGYFGSPPVPDDQILNYYFDEPPKGGWPIVEVISSSKGTGISFHDRSAQSKFHDVCTGGAGLRERRTPRVPTVPDEE